MNITEMIKLLEETKAKYGECLVNKDNENCFVFTILPAETSETMPATTAVTEKEK